MDELISAVERLINVARRDTGQSSRVASFLLAWANSARFGGFDPSTVNMLDWNIRRDMAGVLDYLLKNPFVYPLDLGFEDELKEIADLHR